MEDIIFISLYAELLIGTYYTYVIDWWRQFYVCPSCSMKKNIYYSYIYESKKYFMYYIIEDIPYLLLLTPTQ